MLLLQQVAPFNDQTINFGDDSLQRCRTGASALIAPKKVDDHSRDTPAVGKSRMRQMRNIGMKWAVGWSAVAATVILFVPFHAAQGQTHGSASGSTTFRQCMKASGGVTSAMKACLSGEYTRLDRELNVTYKSVMKQLKTPHLRTRLVESQRVWIWRRDFDCKLKVESSSAKGGTAGDIIYDDCRVEKVRDRIKWLKLVPQNPSYLKKV